MKEIFWVQEFYYKTISLNARKISDEKQNFFSNVNLLLIGSLVTLILVFSISIAILCLVGFTSETEKSVLNPRFDHKTDYENAVLERFELFTLKTTVIICLSGLRKSNGPTLWIVIILKVELYWTHTLSYIIIYSPIQLHL